MDPYPTSDEHPPCPADDEQPIMSAPCAQQKAHEMRMERLLEEHLKQVTQMLSVVIGEVRVASSSREDPKHQPTGLSATFLDNGPAELARGAPEHPKQPPKSLPTTFFDAELQAALPVEDESGPGQSAAIMDSFDAELQEAALPVEDASGPGHSVAIVESGSRRLQPWTPEPLELPSELSSEVALSTGAESRDRGEAGPSPLGLYLHVMTDWSVARLEHLVKDRTHWVVENPWLTGRAAARITRHRAFEYVIQGLILANAIGMGVEQNWQALHIGQELPSSYIYADLAFGCCFLIELVLRLFASGLRFFSIWNKDINWNLFDTLLVVSAIVEVTLKLSTDSVIFDMSSGRLLRLMRSVRILRVVRSFRFFKDLRVMVLSVLGCARRLFFALVLLFTITYVFAVCLLQFVNEELAILSWTQGGRELDRFQLLTFNYGSLARTTYTLFLSISNGLSWGVACEPLFGISWWLGFFYIMYIAFVTFCVLNIFTATFVEEASASAARDEENMLFNEMQTRQRFVNEVKRFFAEADTDNSGQVSWLEFSEILHHVRVQKLLDNLGVDVVSTGARNLFELFDHDCNGYIDIGEFASALTQMRGTARSIDLARLRQETLKLQKDVADILKHVIGEAYGSARCSEGGQRASSSVAAC